MGKDETEVGELKEAEDVQCRIATTDRKAGLIEPSTMTLEERLEKLPAMIFKKKQEIYGISCKLSEVKATITNMEAEEFNRFRKETVPGAKEGITKPKYTVEQAQYEAVKHLNLHNKGYKKRKDEESRLHTQMKFLEDERDFLIDTYKAARTLVWKEVGDRVLRLVG